MRGAMIGFARSNEAPIGLVAAFFGGGPWLGVLGFVATIAWLYWWMVKRSSMAK